MPLQSHKPIMRTQTTKDRGADEVVIWRREKLAQSGLPLSLAARLAQDSRYDLHGLIELLEQGCPPDLAIRILAPLEGDETAWLP
jgi:hypothetical protein